MSIAHKSSIKFFLFSTSTKTTTTKTVAGPPPPPLPPPLKAPSHANHSTIIPNHLTEVPPMQNGSAESSRLTNGNAHDSDEIDSDFGLEVVEEPTLRPSEVVRGNHNRTMSTVSGKFYIYELEHLYL